ncbi:MAG: hypothetical protein WAN14_04810 [Candidatus Acidiferrales bacterium]
MSLGDPKIEKIAVNFRELSSVASTLNTASDELTKVVTLLDEALRSLNIGIAAWTTFTSYTSEPAEEFDYEQIGYCKVNGKWGIAIQRVWGNYNRGEDEIDGPWLFSDAPREMRLNSVDKIPELIGVLSQKASETAKKIQEKTLEVRELAGVIERIASAKKTGLPPPPDLSYKPLTNHLSTLADPTRGKVGGK